EDQGGRRSHHCPSQQGRQAQHLGQGLTYWYAPMVHCPGSIPGGALCGNPAALQQGDTTMNHNDTVAYHRAMLDEKEAGRRNQMARLVHEQEVIDLLKSELGAELIKDKCECCGEIG